MQKSKKFFKIDAGKLFAFSLILLALTTAFSCSSPLIGKSQNAKADFTLKFIISGSSRDAVTKSLAEKEATNSGNVTQSASRLLLETAKTLTVTITSKDSSVKAPEPKTITLESGLSVSVPFTDVPYGAYTIKAEAFAENSPTVLFSQTSDLNLNSSNVDVSLILVPALPLNGFSELSTSVISEVLPAKSSKTWTLPAPARGGFKYNLVVPAEFKVFLQTIDGVAVDVNSIHAANNAYYFTLYNANASNISFSLNYSPVRTLALSFEFAPNNTLTFIPSSISAVMGTVLDISTNTSAFTNNQWYKDGSPINGATSSTYSWTPEEADIGHHILTLTATQNGITYSGDLSLTVTSQNVQSYSVIYSSFGTESGSVPIDTTVYTSGQSATVSGNTGSLVKMQDGISMRFVGWSTTPDGTGDNAVAYAPAATISMTSNITLYPQFTVIGGIGPAGGWVFYDQGSVINGWRYLEAAPVDQSTTAPWSISNQSVSTTDGIGNGIGLANTNAIIAKVGNTGTYAAKLCADLTIAGYSDWYLPTTDELNSMYLKLFVDGLGGFPDNTAGDGCYYWSSEYCNWDPIGELAYNYNITNPNGDNGSYQNQTVFRTRAVRAFKNASPNFYSITYNLNGGSGSVPTDTTNYEAGSAVTIKANTSTMRGSLIQDGISQRFLGWDVDANATSPKYVSAQVIPVLTSNITLYAIWTKTAASGVANAMNGMIGPAGGYVFKDIGSAIGGLRYLEASLFDLAKSGVPWAETSVTLIGTTDSETPASWQSNTEKILMATAGQVGNNAARLCSNYSYGGYSDWALPAPNELSLMCSNLYKANPSIGNFNVGLIQPWYWSSQLAYVESAYKPVFYDFFTPVSSAGGAPQTSTTLAIRAVRAFKSGNQTYTVTYNANNASSGFVPVDVAGYEVGDTVTVKGNIGTLAKGASVCLMWNTKPDGTGTSYISSSTFTMPAEDVILYAQWGDLYVSGSKDLFAGYWKNGVWIPLTHDVVPDASTGEYALGIKHDGTNLYVVGSWKLNTTGYQGVFWKNDISTRLTASGDTSSVDLDVYNGSAYVAGYWYYSPAYYLSSWQDTSISRVDDLDISFPTFPRAFYAVAHVNGNLCLGGYYKGDTTPNAIIKVGSNPVINLSTGAVYSIAVDGNTIVAVGNAEVGGTYKAVRWISTDGGASFTYPEILWDSGFASKVIIVNGVQYICGTDGTNACYWTSSSNTKTVLGGGVQATGIAVYNNNIYISGTDKAVFMRSRAGVQAKPGNTQALLWVNGKQLTLASKTIDETLATDIIFVP